MKPRIVTLLTTAKAYTNEFEFGRKLNAQNSNNAIQFKGENVMLKVHAKNLGTVAILCLQGQIVNGETEILRDVVQSLSGTTAVILDLARVTTVDAHGLGVMLELREGIHAKGASFKLMNISKPLSRILQITRLDSVFQITSGVEFFPAVSQDRRVPMAALKSCA